MHIEAQIEAVLEVVRRHPRAAQAERGPARGIGGSAAPDAD
jgi:hypothetical protein